MNAFPLSHAGLAQARDGYRRTRPDIRSGTLTPASALAVAPALAAGSGVALRTPSPQPSPARGEGVKGSAACAAGSLLLLAALLLALGGCASPVKQEAAKAPGSAATTIPLATRPGPPGLNDPNSPLSKRVIYFDYDSSTIRPEYVEILRAHARYVATTPKAKLMLEGHTDERGTREYNLALAEDRANAVRRFMRAEGAAEAQLGLLSFGEEKPTQPGQGETVWALNRRVELVY